MVAVVNGHAIEVRRGYAVCLTCGRVGKSAELIVHMVETFLRRAS
jgi:hypothetical protein